MYEYQTIFEACIVCSNQVKFYPSGRVNISISVVGDVVDKQKKPKDSILIVSISHLYLEAIVI